MPFPSAGSTDDRAAGVLLGAACGDALGVPYEFGPRLGPEDVPRMIGGGLGPYAPGEYSDDTQMAVCIAEALRDHDGPLSEAALNQTAEGFLTWFREGASDIGNQTARVLGRTSEQVGDGPVHSVMTEVAAQLWDSGTPSAGNGSLMRTGPLALAFLDDPQGLRSAAVRFSALTHADPLAGEACVLWCEGIRHAVAHGDLSGVRAGADSLEPERRKDWTVWLDEAESRPPHEFAPNGFVVRALQAAWSAVTDHPEDPVAALRAAVRAGDDTDTVAAIAGALLGARWGASAFPDDHVSSVHGWPGYRAEGLVELASAIARRHRH